VSSCDGSAIAEESTRAFHLTTASKGAVVVARGSEVRSRPTSQFAQALIRKSAAALRERNPLCPRAFVELTIQEGLARRHKFTKFKLFGRRQPRLSPVWTVTIVARELTQFSGSACFRESS